jgi:hypothetical protein
MKLKRLELIALLMLLLGHGLVIANMWFLWDLLNYFQKFIDPNKVKYFCFWLPYYITCIPYSHWSLAFDILLGINVIAWALIIIGAYLIGYTRE